MKRTLIVALVFLLNLCLAAVTAAQALDLPPVPGAPESDWMAGNNDEQLPHDHVFVEGDMAFPEDIARSRATYAPNKWSDGIVPYEFDGNISPTNRGRMRAAMDQWESVAGVTFVPRSGQFNYIIIVEAGGNWSYVGRIGGGQPLSIYNWTYHYVIMHELAHALGFWHEQSRPDRDQYINIHWGNILAGAEGNFGIANGSNTVGTYDFCSVMHYGPTFFSNGSGPTISAKPAYQASAACMGQQSSLTSKDIVGMQALYPSTIPGDTPNTAVKIPLDASFSFTQNSGEYTASQTDPRPECANGAVSNTVWFTIKPKFDHLLATSASGYNTVLAVYTGSPDSLSPQACIDATNGSNTESLSLPMEADVKYYVMIGSVGGSAGTLIFNNTQFRNLASNGGFDQSDAGWKIKSKPTNRLDDKRKCGERGAFNSKCAIEFKGGSGENSKLTAKITPAGASWNFGTTNAYTFSMDVQNTTADGAVSGTLVVAYTDGNKQTWTLDALGFTNGYVNRSVDLTLSGVVKNVKIKLNVTTASGKSLVDNVVFRPQESGIGLRSSTQSQPISPEAVDSVLPLPAPAN